MKYQSHDHADTVTVVISFMVWRTVLICSTLSSVVKASLMRPGGRIWISRHALFPFLLSSFCLYIASGGVFSSIIRTDIPPLQGKSWMQHIIFFTFQSRHISLHLLGMLFPPDEEILSCSSLVGIIEPIFSWSVILVTLWQKPQAMIYVCSHMMLVYPDTVSHYKFTSNIIKNTISCRHQYILLFWLHYLLLFYAGIISLIILVANN